MEHVPPVAEQVNEDGETVEVLAEHLLDGVRCRGEVP